MRGKRRREAKTSNVILLALGLFAFGFIVAMLSLIHISEPTRPY